MNSPQAQLASQLQSEGVYLRENNSGPDLFGHQGNEHPDGPASLYDDKVAICNSAQTHVMTGHGQRLNQRGVFKRKRLWQPV